MTDDLADKGERPLVGSSATALAPAAHAAAGPFTPADRNPAAVYLATLASGPSRRTMAATLETIAKILTQGQLTAAELPWGQLRAQHTLAVRAALLDGWRPSTANKILAGLRGVLRAARTLHLITADVLAEALAFRRIPGSTEVLRGRALDPGELAALFRAAATRAPLRAARDAALLAVLYGGMLRRAEAVALDVRDYEPATGFVRVRRGKGQHERRVPLPAGGLAAMNHWLALRQTAGLPEEVAAIFVPLDRAGEKLLPRRLSYAAVGERLLRLQRKAQVAHCSPHDLRRSGTSDLLDAGADLSIVQKILGHRDPQTTGRYDRRGDRQKARAAQLLHVPYGGPS